VRSYDIAIASLAISAPAKWTDNLLSQHGLPEVASSRHGVSRLISYPALVRLALIRQLHTWLGLGVGDAIRIAGELLDSGDTHAHESGQLRLTFDRPGLERVLDARLADVLESAPAPRRGRPPKKSGT
jgi:hypothetical protein